MDLNFSQENSTKSLLAHKHEAGLTIMFRSLLLTSNDGLTKSLGCSLPMEISIRNPTSKPFGYNCQIVRLFIMIARTAQMRAIYSIHNPPMKSTNLLKLFFINSFTTPSPTFPETSDSSFCDIPIIWLISASSSP
jgi:hypothetical protein